MNEKNDRLPFFPAIIPIRYDEKLYHLVTGLLVVCHDISLS